MIAINEWGKSKAYTNYGCLGMKMDTKQEDKESEVPERKCWWEGGCKVNARRESDLILGVFVEGLM